MITLLTTLHVSMCIFLIAIVLLQQGKGADMGASFGGGSSQTVFGADGPLPLLNKVTTAIAIVFMVTSVALAYNSAHVTKGSVMQDIGIVPVSKPLVKQAPIEIPLPKADQGKSLTDGKTDAIAEFPGKTISAHANSTKQSKEITPQAKTPEESKSK